MYLLDLFIKEKVRDKVASGENDFHGKVVIVTGASSGIGRQLCLRLTAKGAKVVGCARDREKLESVSKAAKGLAGEFLAMPCDVSDAGQVEKTVAEAVDRFGTLHGLVNNAGQFPVTPLFDLGDDEWDRVLATNLKGPFLCSKAAARVMIDSGVKGRIVNVSSTASLIARPGIAHYASSKAALNMLTKVLALELAPHGIQVNAVLPGLIMTEGVKAALGTEDALAEHRTKLARIPLKREGSPQEICFAIMFFLSDESTYSTGALMVADGGYSLGIPTYK